MEDIYKVKYKNYECYLNEKLIVSRNINLDELKKLYIQLYKTFEKIENTNSLKSIYKYVLDIENIEFQMQDLYKFGRDRNMHRYWFDNKICSCPKMDNRENLGTPYRLTSSDCKMHGDHMNKFIDRLKKLNKLNKYNDNNIT